jgi:excisionase family DNA binding protein
MALVSTRRLAPANDAATVPAADPEIITVEELAVLLRMNKKSLYDLCANGQIPGVTKVGTAWRVHRPTVVAWLSGQIGAPKPRKRGAR